MKSSPMSMSTWWIPALRGGAAVLFGLLALLMPDLTLHSLVLLFSVYALAAGAVAVVGAFSYNGAARDWWVLLVLGLVSMGAGSLGVLYPGLTAIVLIIVVGANAIIIGVLDLVLASGLRQRIKGEWLLILSGVISIASGLLILAYPGAGAVVMVWLIGLYALLSGVPCLALAWRSCTYTRAPVPVATVLPSYDTAQPHQEPHQEPQQHDRRVGERRVHTTLRR